MMKKRIQQHKIALLENEILMPVVCSRECFKDCRICDETQRIHNQL